MRGDKHNCRYQPTALDANRRRRLLGDPHRTFRQPVATTRPNGREQKLDRDGRRNRCVVGQMADDARVRRPGRCRRDDPRSLSRRGSSLRERLRQDRRPDVSDASTHRAVGDQISSRRQSRRPMRLTEPGAAVLEPSNRQGASAPLALASVSAVLRTAAADFLSTSASPLSER
jgi:hypothetical protein